MPRKTDRDDDDDVVLTDEERARMRPAREVMPETILRQHRRALQEYRRRKARGPQRAPTKVMISIRLDREVVDAFRATGRGWQTRMAAIVAANVPRPRADRR